MMAANYRHIGGGENRLGRHYSRFAGIWPTSFLADQSLTLRKSQNAGSNRPSRVNGGWVNVTTPPSELAVAAVLRIASNGLLPRPRDRAAKPLPGSPAPLNGRPWYRGCLMSRRRAKNRSAFRQ